MNLLPVWYGRTLNNFNRISFIFPANSLSYFCKHVGTTLLFYCWDFYIETFKLTMFILAIIAILYLKKKLEQKSHFVHKWQYGSNVLPFIYKYWCVLVIFFSKFFYLILQIIENCHFIPTYILRYCSLLMEDNDIFNLLYHILYAKHFTCQVQYNPTKLFTYTLKMVLTDWLWIRALRRLVGYCASTGLRGLINRGTAL